MSDYDVESLLEKYLGQSPDIDESALIAQNAIILGAVTIGPKVSIWPGCILRADIAPIAIGEGTNLQEGVIIHLADEVGVTVGRGVTVGHGALLHACTVEDFSLIGMRATVMDKAVVGHHSLIGAHSLVTEGTIIPPGSLVMGTPAKVVRSLTEEEQKGLEKWSAKYVFVSQAHRKKDGAFS